MKNKAFVLILLLLLAGWNIGSLCIDQVWAEAEVHCWGLIVEGGGLLDYIFAGDSQYMYHLMTEHYRFDGVCYLASEYYGDMPGVTNETTKENVIWAITEWLQQRSGPNDIVFVYFAVHGEGYKNGYDYANDSYAQEKLTNL